MSSFSSNGGNTNNGASSQARIGEQTARLRESYITNKKGDAVGNNYVIPKNDFSAVLGMSQSKSGELSVKEATSGVNVLNDALGKRFQQIGQKAADMGNEGRNMFIAQDSMKNKDGRTGDAIKEGLDSVHQALHPSAAAQGSDKETSVSAIKQGQPALGGSAMDQYFAKMEKSQAQTRNENDRMLAIQMKLQNMSKQDSTISNLMKTRHDAVSRVIRGGGQ